MKKETKGELRSYIKFLIAENEQLEKENKRLSDLLKSKECTN